VEAEAMAINGSAGVAKHERLNHVGLASYWVSLNFQAAALITIVVPELVERVTAAERTTQLARLAALAALMAMVVPPVTGWFSDRLRARGRPRMPMLLMGTAVNVAGLTAVTQVAGLEALTLTIVVALIGQGTATAAYQAMLPEVVPQPRWGLASGYRALASLAGTIMGLAAGGLLPADGAVWMMVAVSGAGAGYTAITVREPGQVTVDARPSVRIRSWHRFGWVFVARMFVAFGQTLLMTFVLYFFLNVLHVRQAGRGTALMAGVALLGAGVSALVMGRASDRLDRATVVAWAGLPMAAAVVGFGLFPSMSAIPPLAVLWGLGYGTFVSVDWALALDSIPDLANVARDLGIWGIASNFPSVVAPLAGAAILAAYSSPLAGYRMLFAVAGAAFGLGSLAVVPVRRRRVPRERFSPALALVVLAILRIYVALRYRVRIAGHLPANRRGVLVLASHQHDMEAMVIPAWIFAQQMTAGPVVSVGSRRMFEPGFLASHGPRWVGRWLTPIRLGGVLALLGVRPIEDRPLSRPPASWAYEVYQQHGNLRLGDVFGDRCERLALGSPDAPLSSLWSPGRWPHAAAPVSHQVLEPPYREEVRRRTRVQAEADLDALVRALDHGASVYLTPEGRMSSNGRIGPLRTAVTVLAPHARSLYLLPISYDPWTHRRLTMMSRVVPARPDEPLGDQLRRGRVVTLAHLLAAHLIRNPEGGPVAALLAVGHDAPRFAALGAWLAPDVQSPRAVRRAVAQLARQGVIRVKGNGWKPGNAWDRRFPHVPNLVAALAAQLTETRDALARPDAPRDASSLIQASGAASGPSEG